MGRLPRVVVPGIPHHVTQRGTRRLPVFFSAHDYHTYLGFLEQQAHRNNLEIWAYCLMPNHVHLLAVPDSPVHFSRPIGETHRRYALETNRREGWTGHLWQGRFASFPMDETHLLHAVRYVLLNPVRGGLVTRPEDWPHSSAKTHLWGSQNRLVEAAPLAERIEDWEQYLSIPESPGPLQRLRKHSSTGRPLGDERFLRWLEARLGRRVRPGPVPPRNRPT